MKSWDAARSFQLHASQALRTLYSKNLHRKRHAEGMYPISADVAQGEVSDLQRGAEESACSEAKRRQYVPCEQWHCEGCTQRSDAGTVLGRAATSCSDIISAIQSDAALFSSPETYEGITPMHALNMLHQHQRARFLLSWLVQDMDSNMGTRVWRGEALG